MAIVTATRQGEIGFTADRDKLHTAIMNLQIHPAGAAGNAAFGLTKSGCPPMDYWEADAIVNGTGQIAASVLAGAIQDLLACSGRSPDSMPLPVARAIVLNTARAALLQADIQTEAVLQRLEQVVHSLSSLPGQRAVVLISPGFLYATHRPELAEIVDRAIRSDVVVNTIETRRGFNGEAQVALVQSVLANRGAPLQVQARDNLDAVESTAGSVSQDLLSEIADGTGGRFFGGSDNYQSAFSRLAAEPEFYYLLAYSPQSLSEDGKYHAIRVRLVPKLNYRVETRHGFYAPSRSETVEQAAKREIDDALFSNEQQHDLPVKFETRLAPTAPGTQRLAVKADVDVSHLDFQRANGVNAENLTVAAALFDNNGNYVDGTQKSDQMDLKDTTLEQLKKTGFYLELDFDVKPGDYVVRMVARDSNDQHITTQNAMVDVP